MRAKANAQLNQRIIAGIRTDGHLDRIAVLHLAVGQQEMEVRCQASGELDVDVENITW